MKLSKSHLKVTVRKSTELQVPFPALNKLLPEASTSIQQEPIKSQPNSSSTTLSEQAIRDQCTDADPNVSEGSRAETTLLTQAEIPAAASSAEQFLAALERAVSIRVRNASPLQSCQAHASMSSAPAAVSDGKAKSACCAALQPGISAQLVYGQAKIGLLFSGGVDSVVLAALVDRSADNGCVHS